MVLDNDFFIFKFIVIWQDVNKNCKLIGGFITCEANDLLGTVSWVFLTTSCAPAEILS